MGVVREIKLTQQGYKLGVMAWRALGRSVIVATGLAELSHTWISERDRREFQQLLLIPTQGHAGSIGLEASGMFWCFHFFDTVSMPGHSVELHLRPICYATRERCHPSAALVGNKRRPQVFLPTLVKSSAVD